MTASMTPLPVLGVPMSATGLQGFDSLMSIVQMPAGVPVGTLAIGRAGAVNAALLAASILGLADAKLMRRVEEYRKRQTAAVPLEPRDEPPAA
jgi:5-(carboxyamino)imidazole ribonucleotide mutase